MAVVSCARGISVCHAGTPSAPAGDQPGAVISGIFVTAQQMRNLQVQLRFAF